MLQAGYGGYFLIDDGDSQFIDNPVYYEPGYNLMTPLEIETPVADRIYVLIRKRESINSSKFTSIDFVNFEVTASDATTGESVVINILANNIHSEWNSGPEDPSFYPPPLLLQVDSQLDFEDPILRVQVINCYVRDITDNSFISFRLLVSNENQHFHYIQVIRKLLDDRNTVSTSGRQAYIVLNSTSDSYVVFSPYASFKESSINKAEFSYPEGSIYYERQDTFNKEDFIFSIFSYSDSFIGEGISLMNIPSYSKAAIITIDNKLYKDVSDVGGSASVTIAVQGQMSEISDTFIVNFITQ